MGTLGDPGRGEVLVHDEHGPAECRFRPGELIALDADAGRAVERLGHRVDRVRPVPATGLARILLRPDVRDRCVELAADIGGVSANHVHGIGPMVGQPIMLGTGDGPAGAAPPRPPADELWSPPVTVAVLDTGLEPHPWFARRPWLSDWGLQPEVLDADGDLAADRQAGHGTFVAGVVLRHAPGVTLRHHRVMSSSGVTDDVTVAAALRMVRAKATGRGERIDVIVLSAGCYTANDQCPPALHREVAAAPNTVVVAAAGNAGSARPFWPAALPDVVAVAASGPDGKLAEFSNRGDWVDTAAPGVDVVSSFVWLTASPDSAPDTQTREYGAASWSGTSFAAPRVAADVAALRFAGCTTEQAVSGTRLRHPFER